MLKVLHMIGSAKPGGAEMFAVRLLLALHRCRDVEVLAVVRKGSWMEKILREAGVPFKTVPFGGLFDVMTGFAVRRIAREFGPDIIQSWMNRATRFVPKGPWVTVGRLGGFYDLKYYKGKVTYLLGNTDEICDYCREEGWRPERVAMISNFIPAPPEGWRDEREAKRTALGFSQSDVVAMMAGRLHPVKGVDIALRALAELPQEFKLMIVGDGPLREELMGLAQELDVAKRVVWTGWQDNVTPFAAAADMWLAPSRHEPLGNTCLDAWVHEVPVIVSDVGGLSMLVDDGMTGLKVPMEDAAALRDAMQRLAADGSVCSNLVNGGLARFERDYSESGIVAKYLAFYKRITRERGLA